MPTPVLDATPGGVNANSYCDLVTADAYHDSHLYATVWDAATGSTQKVALVMATRLLDLEVMWAGQTTTDTQALLWPRWGIEKKNRLQYIPEDEIPIELKNATAEFARQLLVSDRTADSDIEAQGIKEIVAGPVELVFNENVKAKPIPDAVRNMIPSWWGVWRSAKSASTGRLVRT